MEQVAFATANGQNFTPSGVQGFANATPAPAKDPNAVNPNAVRWMFNPFARLNVSERPISGHLNLKAGVFIPITNQTDRVSISGISSNPGKSFMMQPEGTQETGVVSDPAQASSYRSKVRTAFAISSELEDAYSDRGLRALPSLTGFEDVEKIREIHASLVAPGLAYTTDPYNPEYPVPNLVKLEAHLRTQAPTGLAANVANDLLIGIRTALETCRNVTRDAKRHVANKTQGYSQTFDAWHTRCFLALGEPVPSDLPFVSESGQMSAPGQSDEVVRLRAENDRLKTEKYEAEIARLRGALAQKDQPETANEVVADTIRCDGKKADGTDCNNAPVAGSTRCRHHVETPEEQNEETNSGE